MKTLTQNLRILAVIVFATSITINAQEVCSSDPAACNYMTANEVTHVFML